MHLYALGDPWPPAGGEPLPPGDSFGLYWMADGGLFMLAAVEALRPRELEGLRSETPRLHFGRTRGGLLATAIYWPGFGWVDMCSAHTVNEPTTDRAASIESANRWATDGNHGTVTAIVVDRHRATTALASTADGVVTAETRGDYIDVIGALRYFTLSPAATKYVGRVLAECYTAPPVDAMGYTAEVLGHQQRHPDAKRWADTYAVISCKAGA